MNEHVPPESDDAELFTYDEVSTTVASRFAAGLVVVIAAITATLAWLGVFGLWIWSLSLLNENWGTIWVFAGFLFPPFSLVVVVMCFFWGVPYFFLAFLAWASACFTMSVANDSNSRKSAIFGFVLVLAFGGFSAYLGWKDAITPDPITSRDMDRLEEDATALIAILRASQNMEDDAELAVKLVRAQGRLRDEFADYDDASKDVIAATVELYLKYGKSFENDIIAFFDSFEAGDDIEFKLSHSTRTAMVALPEILRIQMSEDEQSTELINMMFDEFHPDEMPEDWRANLNAAFELQWSKTASVYEYVLDRPMPEIE